MEARRHHPRVNPAEVEFEAVRAQGAGGQNVNKVSNAAHLRYGVCASLMQGEVNARLLVALDDRPKGLHDVQEENEVT